VKRIIVFVFLFHVVWCVAVFAQQKITTVFLVRHAEKSATPADDPVLSSQGVARAELLARMFENTGLKAVYTSQYARTRLTAEPLEKRLKIPVQAIHADATNKLVESILSKHAGEAVLVVGHSNTLPEIVQAFGASKIQEIDDHDYDNLYVITVFGNGTAELLRMKFFATNAEQVCK
jgi:broad specificity phosphatase PhoE